MFRALRWLFYLLIIAAVAFLYWFLPKYSFIKANPTFCTKLTANIWYCGSGSDLGKVYPTQNN